ncbi:hypothetical protein Tco_1159746 [Tanacetum coccineum]
MLEKTPNKVYDPFLKVGLGYKNPERLKKAIAVQPKVCDGEKLYGAKLIIDSPDSEETLENAEESRLKMRNKMKVDETSSKENILQKEIDQLLEVSLASEIQNYVLIFVERQKNKLLEAELAKSSSDSKDIQANLLKRIKILENNFKQSQAQMDLVVKERENVKLEYQKLFNSIKATRAQHKKELDELIEHVTQKTYAYADVRA